VPGTRPAGERECDADRRGYCLWAGWAFQSARRVAAVRAPPRGTSERSSSAAPKYFAPELKHEISRRLRERVMFGADYPLFTYERLERDWHGEGYADDVLDDVFRNNAERLLEQVKRA